MVTAETIYDAFEALQNACEMLKECGKCGEHCPMSMYCIEDDTVPFGEVICNASLDTIKRFISKAERL